jgi:rubrerythrin
MSEGIKLVCNKCGYTWYYKGKRTVYATCPNCYKKVRVVKT